MSIALIFLGGFSSIGPAVYAEIFSTRIRAVGLGVRIRSSWRSLVEPLRTC
ncbi:MAG: hypothetical protein ABI206_05255 [Antricoccus sp.]